MTLKGFHTGGTLRVICVNTWDGDPDGSPWEDKAQ